MNDRDTTTWRHRAAATAMITVIALLLAACGDSDDESTSTTEAGTETASARSSDSADQTSSTEPAPDSTDTSRETVAASPDGSPTEECEALFATGELEDLLGEPVVLDDAIFETTLGGLTCSWTSDDGQADLTAQFIVVQVYGSDPIPANNFYDESIYAEVVQINGVGDSAFLAHGFGTTVGFLDGDVAGFLDYSTIGMEGTDQELLTDEQVTDLLVLLHERAT